jgi:two-component system chemotaxis response regulator CheB
VLTHFASSASAVRKTKVLIVDDSATIRRLLRKIFDASPELEVVGEAERPSQVEGLLDTLQPDVMTLDINMPEMTGVELLRNILKRRFIPTVMISSLNIDEGNEVLDALELGAVDYIHKPSANELAALTPIIQDKIVAAAKVRKKNAGSRARSTAARPAAAPAAVKAFGQTSLIAIGASTGGTEAIKRLFLTFPEQIPPIVVVQHIPPYFSTAFANRLNEICKFTVREAKDGDVLQSGLALIAPGGFQMELVRDGKDLIAHVYDGEPVNRFKPSVDVLFHSVSKTVGRKATGVLLTGMGADGAKGLLAMKNAGAFTICQDEESCVVFGMPRAGIEMGAATIVRSLDDIPAALTGEKAA